MTDDAKQERDSVAKNVVNLYRFDTENDRLRALEAIAVYKTRQPQTDAIIEAQAAEIERISSQRDAYRDGYKKAFADVVKLHDALKVCLDELYAPEPACSCHISPPCGDCVEYSSVREAIAKGRAALEQSK